MTPCSSTSSRCSRRKTASTGPGRPPPIPPAASSPCCPCPTQGTSRNSTSCARSARPARRLEEVTARWFTPPPAWLQEARQQAAERSSQINGELERLAAERPAPDEIRPWWGTLVQWLARDPEKFNEHRVPVHLDLTAAPSCPPPGSPLRAALQAAALHAVGQAPVMTAAGVSQVVHFADACEVTALSLLGTPPDLAPERWAGLALVLAFANCDATDHDQRVLLLTLAAGRAGTAFAEMLPAALSAISPQWTANVAATLAETALGDQADQALLAWATSPDRPAKVWRDTTQALAPHDRTTLPVLASLAPIADRSLPPDDGDSRARWAHAVDLMLLYGPLDEIPARWHQILASADATAAWAQASTEDIGFSLYAHSPVNFWPTAYQMLTPQQAGQLYTRLAASGLVDFPVPLACGGHLRARQARYPQPTLGTHRRAPHRRRYPGAAGSRGRTPGAPRPGATGGRSRPAGRARTSTPQPWRSSPP